MEKDISHLTSEQIDTLMQRYYNGESTKKLLDEYNISVRPAELYSFRRKFIQTIHARIAVHI